MNLAQYAPKGGGGQWLDVGLHRVTVSGMATKEVGDKDLLKYTLRDASGREFEADFFLTEKAYKRLVMFAFACGFTLDDLEDIEYADFIGAEVQVEIIRRGKYKELGRWWSKDVEIPPATVAEIAAKVSGDRSRRTSKPAEKATEAGPDAASGADSAEEYPF